jgi:hypothetical protein
MTLFISVADHFFREKAWNEGIEFPFFEEEEWDFCYGEVRKDEELRQ